MTDQAKPTEGKILSFTDHLQELRVRIIICLAFFVVAFVVSFSFAPKVVSFLMIPLTTLERDETQNVLTLYLESDGEVSGWKIAPPTDNSTTAPSAAAATSQPTTAPLANLARNSFRIVIDGLPTPIEIGPKAQTRLTYLTPLEPFFLWIQGALLLSAILTIPMVVYQFWLFISPGLLKSERRTVGPILAGSIFLFPMGAGFAYAISHVTLKVLLSFGDSIPFLEPNLVASRYLSFILIMMLMFGIVFEFPLVLLLLARLGVVDSQKLVNQRKVAIVVMAIIAAVATPSPDPFSMVVMLAPLLLLYEGSIYTIRFMEKKEAGRESKIAA